VAIGLHQARVAVWNALKESAMREQNATFRSWGSEALRHWLSRRGVPADHPNDARSEPYQLERIATCACSGYFHAGDAFDPFVFHAELPLRD
jgi:hypothetical protein